MSMCDRSVENISGNTLRDNHCNRGAAFSSKRGFCFREAAADSAADPAVAHFLSGRKPYLPPPAHADGKFLANHYAMKNITGEIKTHAVDQMIKSLDPSKTLLYESDLERLKPVLENVFIKHAIGDCASLIQVYDVLVARARENEAIVKNILGPDYRLDEYSGDEHQHEETSLCEDGQRKSMNS